jgi:anti-sigma factor RsiW
MTTNGDNRENNAKAWPERPHAAGIRDDLKGYTDGELSLLRRWQVRRHVSTCAACREEIIALSRVSKEISTLPQPTPRPELRARIMADLPTTPPAPARPQFQLRSLPQPMRLSLVGTMCALLLFSLYAVAHRRMVQPSGSRAVVSSPQLNEPGGNGIAATNGVAAPASRPTIVQNEAQANNQQSYVSNAPHAVASDTMPTSEVLTDPTSREADHILFEERQSELAAAIRHARRLSARQDALVNARRELPAAGGAPEHTVQLAVVDVAAARARLSGLVQEVGGTAVSPNSVIASSESGAVSASRHVAGAATSTPSDAVVSIAVPGNQVTRFQNALRQLGTLSSANSATRPETPGTANGSGTQSYAIPKTYRLLTPRVADTEPIRSSGAERTPVLHGKPTTDGDITNYRVFTIKLQPSQPLLR